MANTLRIQRSPAYITPSKDLTPSDTSSDDGLAMEDELADAFELHDIPCSPTDGVRRPLYTLEHGDDSDSEVDQETQLQKYKSSGESFALYTPDEEQLVLKKLDRRLVLFMALLYMLSFLDRSSKSTLHLSSCS